MNIYDMQGPDFLVLYSSAEIGAVILATLARQAILCYEAEESTKSAELDSFDAAYLNGGAKHMFLTALVSLEHQSKIELNLEEKQVKLKSAVESNAHSVERLVGNAICQKETSIKQVYDSVSPELEKLQSKLQRQGLVPDKSQETLARMIPFQLSFLPLLCLALPKCLLGIERGKPIGFLGMLMLVTSIAALGFFLKIPLRTRKGDEYLSKLKRDGAALQVNFRSFAQNMKTNDLTLAYALFAAFTFNLLNPYRQALAASSGRNIWSYTPASCGGSFYSGGSCGGGGCGGGCGGCGG